ncbi:glycine receptor subunit alphaZ1-like [Mizuhopecten yessoensis]|uniref:Glycine receptor subunit alphaZ1 n=1 Tax=Mizuhopecten yessoensis TaxID=6573 RepID=A0A210PZ58_MIZYE|nr:glycine receptor subunit alphaZ1-like [Mizuhopecten yessoensis]OWF41771.1 Glycine receptor subunit alphaZ1 [Mizuhopecten yessoensis]
MVSFRLGLVIVYLHLHPRTADPQTRSDFIGALIIDYDNRIPPNFEKNNYTEVNVSLFINNIDSISERSMDFTMNAFIQQEWFDFRLQFFDLIDAPYLELDAKLIDDVWVPDLYFTNEKSAFSHDVTVANKMMHLYSNGRVVYRQRVSVTASCPMKLHKYPFDSQVCSLYIQSFAYTLGRLRFRWRSMDPVRTNTNIELPQFKLTRHLVKDCTENGGSSIAELQNFTCIQMDVHLVRYLGFFMIQVYVPTTLIVLLSWVSFWLSIDDVPARVSLGILTVLTITTQKTSSAAAVPQVSYVKALDVWMAICLLFVFVAFLEYPCVYVLKNREVHIRQKKSGRLRAAGVTASANSKKIEDNGNSHNGSMTTGRFIDDISKLIFPAIFLTIIIIYWVVYTI